MQGLVTVFGGSGFVGSQIVRALARKGYRIRIAVRQPAKAYRMRTLGDVGQIELVQANVRDQASIARALDGAEAVVNAVGQAWESGKNTFQSVHIDGARLIAQTAASRYITRFVQISGIGADVNAASAYARARGETEAVVREAMPTATFLRPSVVFGIDDLFFNKLGEIASLSPVLPVIGGSSTLQPVFVGDVAAATARAVSDPACAGRTYELGGPARYTMTEISELVLHETGRKRLLLNLPVGLAQIIGALAQIPAAFTPITPLITKDQAMLFGGDNVVSDGAEGLEALGVQPTALEPILPTYLYRYRKGGQFADIVPVKPAA
jgi:uncharacterized protein YbjT (DUF2867 family)